MKKIAFLSILIVFIASVIWAESINVWFSWEGLDVFKRIAKEFERINPSVKISIQYIPNIKSKAIATKRAGGKLPDLLLIKSDWTGMFVKEGIIEEVSLDNSFIDSSKKAFMLKDGKTYAFPFYFDTQVLFYHKNKIKEFPEYIENFTDKYRIGWKMDSTYFAAMFLKAFGKNLSDYTFKDEATKKAFLFLKKMEEKKNVLWYTNRPIMVSDFVKGKVDAILMGTFLIPKFKKAKVDLGVAMIPKIKEVNRIVPPQLDYKGIAIVKGKKRKILLNFINFILKEDNLVLFTSSLYKFPAKIEAIEKVENKNELLVIAKEISKYGFVPPNDYFYKNVYSEALSTALNLYLSDKLSLDKAIEKAEKYLENNR